MIFQKNKQNYLIFFFKFYEAKLYKKKNEQLIIL